MFMFIAEDPDWRHVLLITQAFRLSLPQECFSNN